MSLGREFKTCFISLMLLLSLLSVFIIVPETAKAESTEATTLYFHHCDPEMLEGIADQNLPVGDNDSAWPPRLKDGVDEFITWAGLWFLIEGNLTELFGGEDIPGFGDILKEFFNPLEYIGIYENTDEETLEINGDIVFDLYFSSTLASKLLDKDSVKVSVSYGWPPITEEIKNVTKILEPKLKGEIQKYEIKIEDINCDLEPGESLTFSIELIPSNKPIRKIIEQIDEEELKELVKEIEEIAKEIERVVEELINLTEPILGWLGNESIFSKFKEFKESLEDYLELFNESVIDEYNITLNDIADLVNILRSSSFIYDSVQHPSSVTLPVKIEGVEEDIRVYYLHEDNKMNEDGPSEKEQTPEVDLSKDGSVKWDAPVLVRSKILKEATASLYIDHLNLRRLLTMNKETKVFATLSCDDGVIATSEKELDKNTILDMLLIPSEPTTFTFSDFQVDEISCDDHLSLELSASNGSTIPWRSNVKLLYDSTEFPSSLTVEFEETEHINVDVVADPSDGKIIPGGSVQYILNITSELEDEVNVEILEENKEGNWEITVVEYLPISMTEGSNAVVHIFANSTEDKKEAYGDTIDLTFVVAGKTGLARETASAEVSEDAIEYDVEIIAHTESKNIKKGENGTFYFIIENKNTGAVDDVDSYTITATSKNNLELLHTDSIKDLERGDKTGSEEIIVRVSVPKNTTLDSDIITLTVTSDSNNEAFATVNVTVNIIGPNILEMLYEFFESAAEDLGLDKVFGSSYLAAVFLAALLFIIIFFIIILLVYFLKKKFVNIVCLERIKEINPDEEAVFEITIKNPTKKTRNYEISSQENPMSPKWDTSLEPREVTLEPEQSKTVVLTVKPTDLVQPDNWMEVKVVVNTVGKQKLEKITTMTIIKDAKPELNITGVFHWPRTFKKGDRVTTSFKLNNKGNASANNVTVVLHVNGEEKNKVEDITIPRGGYADIEMPWIAVKGKNEISIVVR